MTFRTESDSSVRLSKEKEWFRRFMEKENDGVFPSLSKRLLSR